METGTAGSSHLDWQAGDRVNLERCELQKSQNLSPSDTPMSIRPHLLMLPKQFYQGKRGCCGKPNIQTYEPMRAILFKLPYMAGSQVQALRYLSSSGESCLLRWQS